jgi:hypothetical protein
MKVSVCQQRCGDDRGYLIAGDILSSAFNSWEQNSWFTELLAGFSSLDLMRGPGNICRASLVFLVTPSLRGRLVRL